MKNTAIVAVFAVLAFLQVSFLPPLFSPSWLFPALLGVSALAVPIVPGILASLLGGFILDAYSSFPFGFWMLLSLVLFVSAKYILYNYVRLPQQAQ